MAKNNSMQTDAPGPMATALYGRTSKDDPKNCPIDHQKKGLAEWAESDPLVSRVVDGYWDDGVSGTIPIFERPEGRRLRADIEAGKVKCVAVLLVDRFGRNLTDGLNAVRDLVRLGVHLVASLDAWDSRRYDSPLWFQIKMAFAEEEWRSICGRLRRGKKRWIENNGSPPGGQLAFGYRVVEGGLWEIDPDEAPIVIFIFEKALLRWTPSQIAEALCKTSVRPGRRFQKLPALIDGQLIRYPKRVSAKDKTRGWIAKDVLSILHNIVYTGQRVWGDMVFPVPGLVDVPTFEAVQAIIQEREVGRRSTAEEGLLSGLLKCELCGSKYFYASPHSKQRNGRAYYQCGQMKRREALCRSAHVRVDHLDQDVWQKIEEYLRDPPALVARVLAADARLTGEAEQLARQLQDINAALAGLERKSAEIWAEQKANDWPIPYVAPALNALKEERRVLLAQQKHLHQEEAARLLEKAHASEVPPLVAKYRARLEAGLTFADRLEIVKAFIAGGRVETHVLKGVGRGGGRKLGSSVHIQFRWEEEFVPALDGRNTASCCRACRR
jgi:site-specific DNA recombinase